jgi:hypothetical protein
MNEYRFNHIDNFKNAVGAPVVITKGEHKGKKGIVTNVFSSIFKERYGRIFEITLLYNEGEEPIVIHSNDHFDAIFVVDITLEDGKKYFTMRGDVATIHKYKHGGGFYVEYSEITDNPQNDCTEHYEPNGFAYHYDCGMNILKEWKEDIKWYTAFD